MTKKSVSLQTKLIFVCTNHLLQKSDHIFSIRVWFRHRGQSFIHFWEWGWFRQWTGNWLQRRPERILWIFKGMWSVNQMFRMISLYNLHALQSFMNSVAQKMLKH